MRRGERKGKRRAEKEGEGLGFSPRKGCLTWVNSQLTALKTDAKLLPSFVMTIHAGPAVSHSMRTRVCVCFYLA